MLDPRLGFMAPLDQFIHAQGLVEQLSLRHREFYGDAAAPAQIQAWHEEIPILQHAVADLLQRRPGAAHWTILLEYELPEQGGDRPDVIFLTEREVLVLEFKGHQHTTKEVLRAALDQVNGYARDLTEYHEATHGLVVEPYLVLTNGKAKFKSDGVTVLCATDLAPTLADHVDRPTAAAPIDPDAWVRSPYAPLPSLLQAAKSIVVGERLPRNRRAESAQVDQVVQRLADLATLAETKQERHLALITGVPGAGKTLVGLQFVYHPQFTGGAERKAIFLSGNDPLIAVLARTLRSDIFVRPMRKFIAEYGRRPGGRLPTTHAIVFDEAQRAYDAERMASQHAQETRSEPEILLDIAQQLPDWTLVVGLVGQGQEINWGEEGGMAGWAAALRSLPDRWTVHGPAGLAETFAPMAHFMVDDRLNLTTSLRSHIAADVQTWVDRLLEGDLAAARPLAERVRTQEFPLFATTDIEAAKRYVRGRYDPGSQKRYGLLASSRARLPREFRVDNSYDATRAIDIAAWFCDPPSAPSSCCQLKSVITQYQCQGLELDTPIFCWGDDVRWEGGRWQTADDRERRVKQPRQILLNRYRVLLTRGRDGLVVVVPPTDRATLHALREAGVRPLPMGEWQ